MSQQNILKIMAGASKIVRNSAKIIQQKSSSYIEDNFVRGNYVSREEYDKLHKVVIKLEEKLANLSNKVQNQPTKK